MLLGFMFQSAHFQFRLLLIFVQVAVLVMLNIFYNLPFFLDKKLYKVKNEDNSTSLVRSNSALGNSNVYQWLYKTILFYVVMYGMPLIMLAVFTGFLLRALTKARIKRQRMTGHKVSLYALKVLHVDRVRLRSYNLTQNLYSGECCFLLKGGTSRWSDHYAVSCCIRLHDLSTLGTIASNFRTSLWTIRTLLQPSILPGWNGFVFYRS